MFKRRQDQIAEDGSDGVDLRQRQSVHYVSATVGAGNHRCCTHVSGGEIEQVRGVGLGGQDSSTFEVVGCIR